MRDSDLLYRLFYNRKSSAMAPATHGSTPGKKIPSNLKQPEFDCEQIKKTKLSNLQPTLGSKRNGNN